MHHEVSGQGPALILLHGWGLHGGFFGRFATQLSEHYRVHRIDLPGHGLASQADEPIHLERLAARLVEDLGEAIWLGWSLGGLLALQAAVQAPQQVRALVLMASSPCFVRRADWPQGTDPAVFQQFHEALRSDFEVTVERFIELEVLSRPASRLHLPHWLQLAFAHGRPGPLALDSGLSLLEDCDFRDHLPHLAMPSLWLGGRRDRLVRPDALSAAAALMPNAELKILPGAGHAPFLDQLEPLNDALHGFLQPLRSPEHRKT